MREMISGRIPCDLWRPAMVMKEQARSRDGDDRIGSQAANYHHIRKPEVADFREGRPEFAAYGLVRGRSMRVISPARKSGCRKQCSCEATRDAPLAKILVRLVI